MFRRNRDIERRSRRLAAGRRGRGPVVYWMSRDQRAADNWSLLWAQQEALIRDRPVLVVFCLDRDGPGATLRHWTFMLRGLRELQEQLARYRIGFRLLEGGAADTLPDLVRGCDAHVLVTDFDPLRAKRRTTERVGAAVSVPFYEVDSHNIIPAWITSGKKEYAAYTIRPKIGRLLDDYLTDIPPLLCQPRGAAAAAVPVDVRRLSKTVADHRASPAAGLPAGEEAGNRALRQALEHRLAGYHEARNDPCRQGQSGLSPYLHFGQISAQRLAWLVARADIPEAARAAFLEELVVRRELAENFCFYEPSYDGFDGFPDWARQSLACHRADRRTHLYSLDRFEQADTHEPLWNACQQDLMDKGTLHGYLRMYWAKKFLEWTAEPEEALAWAIRLNDRYALDGSDPNGYTGIAWSIGGVHDRPWPERAVFGRIRFMSESGCRRKFAVDTYIRNAGTRRQ